MANQPADGIQSYGHPDMDYVEHDKTYKLFITLFKWGTVFCIACVVVLAVLTL